MATPASARVGMAADYGRSHPAGRRRTRATAPRACSLTSPVLQGMPVSGPALVIMLSIDGLAGGAIDNPALALPVVEHALHRQ